jgi:hypothetical protein
MSWVKLRDRYQDKGIALVLGAGISYKSGIPTWAELLRRLAKSVNMDPGSTVDGLCQRGLSFPAIAAVIQSRFQSRAEFVEAIRDQLYATFPFYPCDPYGWDSAALVDFVTTDRPNHTLRAVTALCAASRYNGVEPNRRIHAVATLNLDYLVQAYSRARYGRRLLRTVERASASSSSKRTSLFHLHGLLRFDVGIGKERRLDRSKEAPDGVVLTEHDYFDFFNSPNSMFNYTFLYLLREYSCLFIGTSMTDDNIRRLLHYSFAERRRHLLAEGEEEADADQRSLRHFVVLEHSSESEDRLIESSLAGLGVAVLWLDKKYSDLDKYSDLPRHLAAVYEEPSRSWDAVFD